MTLLSQKFNDLVVCLPDGLEKVELAGCKFDPEEAKKLAAYIVILANVASLRASTRKASELADEIKTRKEVDLDKLVSDLRSQVEVPSKED